MVENRTGKAQRAGIAGTGVTSRASAGATLTFSLVIGAALTSLAIGVWSLLSVVGALSGQGPLPLV